MRIKEVEEHIGITSKNIRFYEKEGLLLPNRNTENGYREYSEVDLEKLKKIKLLRKLGISIEDIRLLQVEQIEFSDVLNKQIDNFKSVINSLNEAANLCVDLQKESVSFKNIDSNLWLSKMNELERKGARFMDINNDEIIRFLPDKFKMQYYESIIKSGQIDSELLEQITSYFEEIYRKSVDTEKLLIDTLKNVDYDERNKLLDMVKENNVELYAKLSNSIFDFEGIVTVKKEVLKDILNRFDIQSIVKASMAASPQVNEYLQGIFTDIDFIEEKKILGSRRISEVLSIQDEIIKEINNRIK
ncbi:MerR family transcriptional regulator [Inconstantimicrobium mannanitabidum]|uniref:MerR family transcriptional regulator n=1 Tax=Inconstantimicrobium mannanitabidum TaxID=1604901 RepID=A0ACB5RFR1_9CLOT|nr:MerR family transcriptional regulator [Clostridium sp. TW13]GKX67931.1 MerR family transcriptional regulator [Clostridium sp. TW13]